MQEWREENRNNDRIKMPLDIRIVNNKKQLIIKSKNGEVLMCLPLQDPSYLQTHHVKILNATDLFTQTILEVLSILNENFPGHLMV